VLAACARTSAPPAQPVSTQARIGDPVLYEILGTVPPDSAAELALQHYELTHPLDFLADIADVASDPAAGTPARYNAVLLLGDRKAGAYVNALQDALTDRDPRVRAAAVVAAGKILAASGVTGKSVLVSALEDPEAEVQAKALEVLGVRDLPLLRGFLGRHPDGEGAVIARGLLQSAEQRGAPLAADSTGLLQRTTMGGLHLVFSPTRRWPEWGAEVGTVVITGGTNEVSIPHVEVVEDVVPVFFSPDESALVYEQDRQVFVRDLATGQTREIGPGIAPRPLPFTDDFVFFRAAPERSGELDQRMRLSYDILRASFHTVAEPTVLGQLGTWAEMGQHGNYSPARWLRVVEQDGRYTLEGDGAETFQLPDPFHAGGVP